MFLLSSLFLFHVLILTCEGKACYFRHDQHVGTYRRFGLTRTHYPAMVFGTEIYVMSGHEAVHGFVSCEGKPEVAVGNLEWTNGTRIPGSKLSTLPLSLFNPCTQILLNVQQPLCREYSTDGILKESLVTLSELPTDTSCPTFDGFDEPGFMACGNNSNIDYFTGVVTSTGQFISAVDVCNNIHRCSFEFPVAASPFEPTGKVVTWGDQSTGGDISFIESDLAEDVQKIYSNEYSFAAQKSDGSVITWGIDIFGGDSSVADLSSGVKTIYACQDAYAALKDDGSVVTWGRQSGGESYSVWSYLSSGVSTVIPALHAFAALKQDGHALSWGYSDYGGNFYNVESNLHDIISVVSTRYNFAALRSDGAVITWGGYPSPSENTAMPALTSGVVSLYANMNAFAALKIDGSVATWGFSSSGGYSGDVASILSTDIGTIYTSSEAFAAIKASTGAVVTWGSSNHGGDSSAVSSKLQADVEIIYSTQESFAAIKKDGSVVTWGSGGGDSSSVAASLESGIAKIFSTSNAFAALKDDGSVITWGIYGGDSSSVAEHLTSGVTNIYSTNRAFAAVKKDGSVFTWGDPYYGGDSSFAAPYLTSGVSSIWTTGFAFAALIPKETSPPTRPPTTLAPTTIAPTTAPTTTAPTTTTPTTIAPTTIAPTTTAPTTTAPTTTAPTTTAPTTTAPTTTAPTTTAPTTTAPTTLAPSTGTQTTNAPTAKASATEIPITEGPTTISPTAAPTIKLEPIGSIQAVMDESALQKYLNSTEAITQLMNELPGVLLRTVIPENQQGMVEIIPGLFTTQETSLNLAGDLTDSKLAELAAKLSIAACPLDALVAGTCTSTLERQISISSMRRVRVLDGLFNFTLTTSNNVPVDAGELASLNDLTLNDLNTAMEDIGEPAATALSPRLPYHGFSFSIVPNSFSSELDFLALTSSFKNEADIGKAIANTTGLTPTSFASVNPCAGRTCSGHGTCVSDGSCVCDDGYQGFQCQSIVQTTNAPQEDDSVSSGGVWLGSVIFCVFLIFQHISV